MWLSMGVSGAVYQRSMATGTIYTRMNCWARKGVLERVFNELQKEQAIQLKIEGLSPDSTAVKVHPDGTGVSKKTVRNP